MRADGALALGQEISVAEDQLETRGYREACVLHDQESDQFKKDVFPLLIPEKQPIGVISITDFPAARGTS